MAGIDIAAWLRDLGLAQYQGAFAKNAVDAEILLELTAEDLKELGVEQVGHRRKILAAIAALRAGKSAVNEASAAAPEAPAERRLLTVLFCDLVGSTALSRRLDPEDLREVIGAYHRSVAETIGRYGGFVAKYMGDGVLAYFGYPEAHEDDAEEAVRAALALIGEVGRLETGERLKLRAGIATGLVVVGDLIGEGAAQEYRVVGETPNLAARLQAMAPEKGVLIGEATRRLVGDLFEYRALGAVEIKGFEAAVPVFEVLRPSAVESRFEALRAAALTPLVGREEEIELLLRRWRRAAEGEGQVVLISGEPGIGKSRLAVALRERLAGEAHTRIRYFCSPHHQDSALYPFISQLERAALFEREDPLEKKLDKLEALLAPASPPQEEVGLLAELLSLPAASRYPLPPSTPQRRKEKTFAALLRQMEALARQKPLLIVFEDLHWIDPSSRELLDRMIERLASLRILLLATFRPEFAPPWSGLPQVTAMTIARLDRRTGAAMVESIAANSPLSSETAANIVERADGVPLFVEELTKAVLEAGGSEGVERTLVGAPSPAASVPAALHAPLMARLDRLGQAPKEIAQVASAIGREFSYELLPPVAERRESELLEALGRLGEAGLIFRRGSPPYATYLFKHALVRDAAYGSLLRRRREALHARIASVLEADFPERVAAEPELLARHLTEAGLPDKAVPRWLRAGERAMARSANQEAIAHLTAGLAQLAQLPETQARAKQELALQRLLGQASFATSGYASPEAGRAFSRARELCAAVGEDANVFPVLHGVWLFELGAGYPAKSEATSHELLERAQRVNDIEARIAGNYCVATGAFHLGGLARAHRHLDAAIDDYRGISGAPAQRDTYEYGFELGAAVYSYDAWCLWLLGYPDRALQLANEALAILERIEHGLSRSRGLYWNSAFHGYRGEWSMVEGRAAASIVSAQEHGHEMVAATGRIMRGAARAMLEPSEDAVAEIRQGLAAYAATGARVQSTYYLALLAQALARCGHYDDGLTVLGEAAALVEETGERFFEAEIHRLRGNLLLALDENGHAEAEACYRKALEVAQAQEARSLELRAACDFARLLAECGERGQAAELLAPIYSWFTEGFDTADLKEAKALLDSLR